MGKKLIIKGADFSENAIFTEIWYNPYEELQGGSTYNFSSSVIPDPDEIKRMGMLNKPINRIMFYAISNNVLTGIRIVEVTGSRDSGDLTVTQIDERPTLHTVSGINEIRLTEPIVLSEGQSIRITNVKDNLTKFSIDDGDSVGFKCLSHNAWNNDDRVAIMFGYSNE